MEANKKLGFATIRDRATGKVVLNDQARGTGKEVSLDSDSQAHNFMNPNFYRHNVVGPPHYSIDLPAALLPPREGENLFGVSIRGIKSYWERLLALPPDHPERVYGLLSTTRNCNAVVAEALMAGCGCMRPRRTTRSSRTREPCSAGPRRPGTGSRR